MKTISETMEFICHAHKGQKDKQGVPYWFHPVAVADIVARRGGSNDEICAALLHDVVEDTAYSLYDLTKMGFSNKTLTLVLHLTRRQTETHWEYLHRIADSKNREAMLLKLADIQHNTDKKRGSLPSGMVERYRRSIIIIAEGLRNLL